MIADFWKSFYHGEINPLEWMVPLGKEGQRAQLAERKEWEKFSALLSDEQKKAYYAYESALGQYNSLSITERFTSGFTLGMMFVCEAMAHSRAFLAKKE